MLDPRTYWWISRSTGIIAWAVLTLSVIWGLALTTRLLGKFPKPAWMLDLHKHFASLASILVGVHVVSLMLDGYARFSISDILIPMHTQWKPGPIAWGVVSLYVLIAVQGTSLAKRHLPLKVWRMLHFLSYPLWALATAHFITAGTDAYEPVFAYTVIGTTILISALTLGRLLSPRAARVPSAASSAAAAAAASSAAPASAAASETAGAKKPSAERVPRVKAAGNAAPGSRAEMIAKARAQAAAAKSDSGDSPSEETPTPLPEAPAAAAAAAPAPAAPAAPPMEAAPAPQRAVAPQPEPAAAQPVVTAPVREDLVARARAAAAAANAGKSAPKPSAANSTNDAITRAREAALIELARRSADKGSSSSQQPEAAASEVIDLSTGSQEQISPSE